MTSRKGSLKKLGRYAIEREIGRGAMGVVYLARDPVIGRQIALKTVRVPSDLGLAERRERFERFAREARAAGTLSHPGIVTVFDAGRDESADLAFIVMEYVPGRTLKDELSGGRRLPHAEVAAIAARITDALAHAHDRGVVHRDLKPANILLGEGGSVKIADFGVARLKSSDLTTEGACIGSPAFMSPEQILGEAVDGRSDLFSIGVLLYEMLSGVKPFGAADASAVTYRIVNEPPGPLSSDIPSDWRRIVSRLLEKRPSARYPDARALLADLQSVPGRSSSAARAEDAGDCEETVVERAGGGGAAAPAARAIGGVARLAVDGARAIATRGKASAAPALRSVARTLAAPALRSVARILADRTGRRRVLLIGAGALGAVLFAGTIQLVLGASRVEVVMKHGFESGRLRIEVDGREVVDRRFRGESRSTRMFGKEMFERTGGELTDSFSITPGEHEIRVVLDGDGEEHSRTIKRTLPRGAEAHLRIKAGTAFARGLKLDWSATSGR